MQLTGPMLDGFLGAGATTAGVAAFSTIFFDPGALWGGAGKFRYLAKNSSSQLKKACLSSGDRLVQSIFSSSTGCTEALLAIETDRTGGGGGGDTLSGRVSRWIRGGARGGGEAVDA